MCIMAIHIIENYFSVTSLITDVNDWVFMLHSEMIQAIFLRALANKYNRHHGL